MTGMDVHQRDDLVLPQSLPEFQPLFPVDAARAAYPERARWADSSVCPHCGALAEPFRIAAGHSAMPTCRRHTGLLVGTVMERSHTPLNIWFWAAYLVASQTPGISAVQFQRQLGLSRHKTAFGILHKLRAGMVRPDQESAASLIGMSKLMKPTSAAGPVAKAGRPSQGSCRLCSVEVRHRKPSTAQDKRKVGWYARRTIGAATPDCASAATTPTILPNVAIRKWPKIPCLSSISYSPTSRHG
jgi:hypothetical protein